MIRLKDLELRMMLLSITVVFLFLMVIVGSLLYVKAHAKFGDYGNLAKDPFVQRVWYEGYESVERMFINVGLVWGMGIGFALCYAIYALSYWWQLVIKKMRKLFEKK